LSKQQRLWELDALRGLMLVLMATTHLPTRFSSPMGQPFGFVSAAEGFVLMSAFMAGKVYTLRAQRDGEPAMRDAFYKRVLKIYTCQIALFVFLLSVVAVVGIVVHQGAIERLVSFYLAHPFTALFAGLVLVYSPPLLDILPLYVLLMLASPVLLLHGRQQGWGLILALSVLLWFGAQFDLGHAVYRAIRHVVWIPVPFHETGAFELFGWQFLWVFGLWMGSRQVDAPGESTPPMPRWLVRTAIFYATVCFIWRHAIGQNPFLEDRALNLLFDKWHLGPLRLINTFALVVLVLHFAPLLRRLPRMRWLETVGAASLPVFCAHLVLALMALALFGDVYDRGRPWTLDVAILGVSFAILYAVALISRGLDRQAAQLAHRVSARRQAARPESAAGGP
jgi:hypothetical protein